MIEQTTPHADTSYADGLLKPHIRAAIRCGAIPPMRDWRNLPVAELTRAERVMLFIERYCVVPEGKLVGTQMKLIDFQEVFLYCVYDSPTPVTTALLSIARKNGKTGLIAALAVTHLAGPEAQTNSQLVSGAMSRAQAQLVYGLASKMVRMSPKLRAVIKMTPSGKTLAGLRPNTTLVGLSREATTAYGLSPVLAIIDEAGQIVGASSPFIDAITTAQGAHDNPLVIFISTQSPSDADMFSIMIDDATRSGSTSTVCHVYEHKAWPLDDEDKWIYSNPALGVFRSEQDMRTQAQTAMRMPNVEARTRNLIFNQRVSAESLFISPSVWRNNSEQPSPSAFFDKDRPVHIGLDLSTKTDLTAAVIAARDEHGIIHLLTYPFAPLRNVEAREMRDKASYSQWARAGQLHLVPGEVVDYDWVCEFLKLQTDKMRIASVQFDRWRINDFKEAAKRTGFYDRVEEWKPVGQGYIDFSPRVEAFEAMLLREKLRHGNHPVLNLGASHAIVIQDPARNRKIDKSKTSQRIDALIAALMATYPLTDGAKTDVFDVDAMIG